MAFGLALLSCGHLESPPEAGRETTLYHNWWNCYERGLALMEQGDYEGASLEFERTLGLKPGARFGFDREMWRARTYGLHFVENYFPHRELGICRYRLGRDEEAVEFLVRSLEQEPSSRAKFFLNLARARQAKKNPGRPPRITIRNPPPGVPLREREVRLSGIAAGDARIGRVSVNEQPVFVELAEKEIAFDRLLPLREGSNFITCVAEDLAGQQAVAQVTIWSDRTPPGVVIIGFSDSNGARFVRGAAADNYGLAYLAIDGTVLLQARTGSDAPASRAFSVPLSSRNALAIEAVDVAGNTLRSVLPLEAVDESSRAAARRYASAAAAAPAADGPEPEEYAPEDRMRPSLTLHVSAAEVAVYDEEYYLEGLASDPGGLAALSINGEGLMDGSETGGVQKLFARLLPLDPGTNRFVVAARDRAGNLTKKEVAVVRLEPEYLDAKHRLRVALAPCSGGDDLAETIHAYIEADILRAPARFSLVERDDRAWSRIVQEQEISLSELADRSAALRIGKMMPAELLLLSSVIRHERGLTIYARLVDTSEGTRAWAGDIYCDEPERALEAQVDALAMKLKQAFPLLDATVTGINGERVAMDAGAERGVRAGTRLLVLKTGAGGDRRQGKVLYHESRPVEIEVTRTGGKDCLGLVTPRAAAELIDVGNAVYTR